MAAGFAEQIQRLFGHLALCGNLFLLCKHPDARDRFFVEYITAGKMNRPVEMKGIGAHNKYANRQTGWRQFSKKT